MKVITESEMNFENLMNLTCFILKILKFIDLGDGIKTVEFILKYKEDSIIFLEAKEKLS